MKYIRGLDALRAIAVILVIIWHWAPQSSWINYPPNGYLGVDIFFVLSGFLITGILLQQKGQPVLQVLKTFYIRRSLRIFPIYYLYIFILVAVSSTIPITINDKIIPLLTYTINFYLYASGWQDFIAHLWSLAVEEQFYLIWPVVIILTPTKHLPYVISSFIIIGIAAQSYMSNNSMSIALSFNCFHAFGIGAMGSWLTMYKKYKIQKVYFWIGVAAILCLFDLILQSMTKNYALNRLRVENSIIGVWIIMYIINNKNNLVFNNRYLVGIGKMSYGIYLYHLAIPFIIKTVNNSITPKISIMYYQKYNIYVYWFDCVTMLLVISWLSYRFIETPFLSLKDKFKTHT